MKYVAFALLLVFLAGTAGAQTSAPATTSRPASTRPAATMPARGSLADTQIQGRLQKSVLFQCSGLSWRELCDALGAQLAVPIAPDVLADKSLEKRFTVTLRHPLAATSLLDWLARNAPGNARWQVHQGAVEIVPGVAAGAAETIEKTYDLQGVIAAAGPARHDLPIELRARDLSAIIECSILPDSWQDCGGTVGTLVIKGGAAAKPATPMQMVITHTAAVHQQIAWLLATLSKRAPGAPGAAMPGTGGDDSPLSAKAAENLKINRTLKLAHETFATALDKWSLAAGIDVLPDWRSLPDLPAAIDLDDSQPAPAGKILEHLLAVANASCTRRIDHGVMILALRGPDDRAAAPLVIRIYDVGEVLGNTGEASARKFITDLEGRAAKDSWRDLGGTVGSMQTYGYMLIVTNTPDAQSAVERALRDLRKKP